MMANSMNKCELRGLRVIFKQKGLEQTRGIEEFFVSLRDLQKEDKIPKGWPRVVNASIGVADPNDSSEICAINNPSWQQKEKNANSGNHL